MIRNKLYYRIKPLIPWRVRLGIRRLLALRTRHIFKDKWPVLPGSERPPLGWKGWPDGKKFAVVLTHDVERRKGLTNCEKLMQLEMKHGFCSSFNFVPEADYSVPPELRTQLNRNGFEVGVHDLRHDGKLYSTRLQFSHHARRINDYLEAWESDGFRSGFMLRQLDWLHD